MGIDVGGTFTDGVVFSQGQIVSWVKVPTEAEDLEFTILKVMDDLLKEVDRGNIKRLVMSTTLVTNLLATGKLPRVGLLLIPGPGLAPKDLDLGEDVWAVRGGIDFRGREIEKLDAAGVKEAVLAMKAKGIEKGAVVGKFSQRNPRQEDEAARVIKGVYPEFDLIKGHEVSGRLNFPRRAVTAKFTLATRDAWNNFADAIEEAVKKRGINVPIEVMKADGGALGLDSLRSQPCETVFSGPAASTMGGFALTMDELTSVVVDIGGTTTDLAFILGGKPLHASKGAKIEGRYTQIKALAVSSVPLGGDSVVKIENGEIKIGPEREGVAACFGGPQPTPTDAFNLLSGGVLDNVELSRRALGRLAGAKEAEGIAQKIVDRFVALLQDNVNRMLRAWEEEPAYKVWEIIHKRKAKVDRVIGIGAAAPAFVPILAERMGCAGFVHRYCGVANALGASVARPTLQVVFHADTQNGVYSVNGMTYSLEKSSNLQLEDAKRMAERELERLVAELGIPEYFGEREFLWEEQFNVIRGWSRAGKIFDIGVAISPGVIAGFKGVQA